MKSCSNIFFLHLFASFYHLLLPPSLDYSDENGNVSGAESDRKNENNEIPTSSHEDRNEIEDSTTTLAAPTTTTTTEKVIPRKLPCDEDNGGCDQHCQMVADEYDSDPRIECSCSHGFTLDEVDGRRCHGMKINLNLLACCLLSFSRAGNFLPIYFPLYA
jgi:hypothetical protein